MAGISASSLRNYTGNELYRPYFSHEAAPPPGTPRLLTVDDVKLLRFIAERSAQGAPHADIAGQIAAGALDAYDWQPPAPPVEQGEPGPQDRQQAALALMPQVFSALQAQNSELTQALIQASRDVAGAQARIIALEQEIEHLQALLSDKDELRRLQAELVEARKPGLLRRLLGR